METSEYGYKQKLSDTLVWDKEILTLIKRWWRNYRTRKQLENLPEHLLDDLGLTKEQAHQESIRRFWDK
ncbi:DUF1127 domain-containing protein [Vibrio europaeus]|uniref:YjiS-like domain-containing protein n=3 Tax=Vibrio oreintalis group TaxID=1891919 RepID=F9TBI2_9VIBR|nr:MULTISPECIES: DUF1127 domain-containing protein [Vibrio oreintalis group]AIW13170.1 hypothetical protein IX91_02985 [Vibrio tubiashii ATCC 19109]EGU48700.1 hypothetical protein VITU9109_21784 [Vibrio tubiashii ATCC 19109]EIF01382.1 hypothetical protein VT1337_23811 [Vibrio tubiashii NCIMB 1337 = ATCC 19106]MCG9583449.1 DUF1127 domain-containing protein [Vibrio tubiashii]MCG9617043.1 DUF1127 domain-containing protein [Vibrio tubiashii]